ncbi:ParB/RepB/Spo0J family partition protein [Planctomycetes bacterium TBK1r]|uniref:Chromosome-partitioning protein Spo0J n=1 Tax=Stieleria magnilauensis TaxID=2527963 RepID=A0ABX5XKV2_9BACT|nr:Chromosome-partitioning protein Spo0J [Planctomycetes bacterium TBK1r]
MSKADSFNMDNHDFTSYTPMRSPEPIDGKMEGRRMIRNAAHIELSRIITRAQVREDFDEDKLHELADSLTRKGQQQPIRVYWDAEEADGGRYVVLMGERRFRAAQMANFETIQCIIHEDELSEAEITELQLLENIVRQDLNPIEEARAFRKIMDDRKASGLPCSAKDLAKEIGFSDSKVARSVRLLTLPEDIQGDVAEGSIPPSVIREVLKLKTEEAQRQMITTYKEGGSYGEIAETVKMRKGVGKGASSGPRTKKSFSADGIKIEATAKKRVTQAEIAVVLKQWLKQIQGDGRVKAA